MAIAELRATAGRRWRAIDGSARDARALQRWPLTIWRFRAELSVPLEVPTRRRIAGVDCVSLALAVSIRCNQNGNGVEAATTSCSSPMYTRVIGCPSSARGAQKPIRITLLQPQLPLRTGIEPGSGVRIPRGACSEAALPRPAGQTAHRVAIAVDGGWPRRAATTTPPRCDRTETQPDRRPAQGALKPVPPPPPH